MEYEHRRKRFFFLVIYLLYTVGVVYLLMTNNKFLYSHKELRSYLKNDRGLNVVPIPKADQLAPLEASGTSQFWPRFTPESTGVQYPNSPFAKNYFANWHQDLQADDLSLNNNSMVADSSGVYVASQNAWVFAFGPEGEQLWKFRFLPTKAVTFSPVIDQSLIYMSWSNGEVATLNKKTGLPYWKLKLGQKILGTPVLLEGVLFVPVLPFEAESVRLGGPAKKTDQKKGLPPPENRLALVKASTGELINYSEAFAASDKTTLSYVRETKQVLLTSDNRLLAINQENGRVALNEVLPDKIIGPAMYAEGKILVALSSGKIQSWDQNKKGKFDWEISLDSTPAGSLTYIPLYQRLVLITENSRLQMIDFKKTQRLWHFNLENHNTLNDTVALQLQGKFIEQYNMPWDKKGWTVLAPCSDRRLCLYNPDKGQIIGRVMAPGQVVTAPAFVGKNFYLLSVEEENGKPRYKLTQFMDKEKADKAPSAAENKPAATTTGG